MVPRKFEKSLSLALAAAVLILSATVRPSTELTLHYGCGLAARIAYSLFHGSVLHALLNAWCLLSIVFIHNISWCRLFAAWAIAISVPSVLLSDTPVVGLSAVCFALLGMIFAIAARPWAFLLWLVPYFALGFAVPCIAGLLHLYAFTVGAAISLLTRPFTCKKK